MDWLTSLTGDVAITSATIAELLAGLRRMPTGRRKEALTSSVDAVIESCVHGGGAGRSVDGPRRSMSAA